MNGGFDADLANNDFESIGPLENEIMLISHPNIIQLNATYLKDLSTLGYLLLLSSHGV